MARWEPNARDRLAQAAIALFAERGYEGTTVADIVDRAGLTKSTFFRHFTDKREVLFAGQDELLALFGATIRAAPPSTDPIGCLAALLAAVAPLFDEARHETAATRNAVIADSPELRERDLLKRARLAAAVEAALLDRGTEAMTARLAAEIGVLAFGTAYERWSAADDGRAFSGVAAETLTELCRHAAALGGGRPRRPPTRPARGAVRAGAR